MKISVDWLRDYVACDLEAHALADLLARRGMEVEDVAPVGEDACITLEITANRPDLLSHLGIAREVAAHLGTPLRVPEVHLHESDPDVHDLVRVDVAAPDLCPRYTARVLTDVAVGPAPPWMQRRLQTIGLRPVNNVVDITNYVLMECGQPEHAFDFACLDGARIVVRPAVAGEVLTLIDGTNLELRPEYLVIADAHYPVALAGIMGGLESEIGDRTRAVLLESAQFHPVSIRRTTRSTGKASDSSYRFERGVDTPTVEWASRRAAALIQEHAGARLAAGLVDVDATRPQARRVRLRVPRIERVLGMPVPRDEAAGLLGAIGFGVQADGADALDVAVPSFRPDVSLEEDLIEEVARCRGYEAVPADTALPVAAVTESRSRQVARLARQTLIRLGYVEVLTTTFLPETTAAAVSPWSPEPPLVVRNPLRADEAALRTSLLPALLAVKRTNQAQGIRSVRIFEANRVYLRRPGEPRLPEEKTCLALLTDDGFRPLKGAVETLLDRLGLAERVSLDSAPQPFLAAGAAAAWHLDGRPVGWLGQVAQSTAEGFDLLDAPWACELDLDALVPEATLERRFAALPRFPTVERDLAIVVDEATSWADVCAAIRDAGAEHLESVSFEETYRGEQIEQGKKSLLFRLVYRAPDRTLTSDEVNASQERVVAALTERLGATLRA